jgi:hypothetical protein
MEPIEATYAIVTLHNNMYNKGPHCVKAGNLSEILIHDFNAALVEDMEWMSNGMRMDSRADVNSFW